MVSPFMGRAVTLVKPSRQCRLQTLLLLTERVTTVSKSERKKLDKRERIKAAAWSLFRAKGYDETTTKAIAEKAGIATGTLFLYASDKRDVLALVMHDRIVEIVDARFASLPAEPRLIPRLMHVFTGLFAMYGEHPRIAAAWVEALPGIDGPNGRKVRAMTMGFLYRMSLLVREAQNHGEIADDIDPMQAAINVFALYFNAMMAWLSGYTTLEGALDPGLRTALELQMRGLRAR
jgi:AcrR family transcriptional regulator